jgi:hypothetical protein
MMDAFRRLGPKWKAIGGLIGRLPESCRDRWRTVGAAPGKNVGRWGKDEEACLRLAVAEYDKEIGLVRFRPSAVDGSEILPFYTAAQHTSSGSNQNSQFSTVSDQADLFSAALCFCGPRHSPTKELHCGARSRCWQRLDEMGSQLPCRRPCTCK